MKTRIFFYLAVSVAILMTGCELDNFEEPSSELNGQILYDGSPIGVKDNEVELELWQDGYELSQDIPVYVAQDGSFSATLFDGDYQLVLRQDNGPWVDNSDSITVNLEGSAEVDVHVEPFYIINKESINYNNGSVEASFTVEQINDSRDLEFVGLYIGMTNIVDQVYNEANTTEAGDQITFGDTVNLAVDLSNNSLENRENVYVRVGLKVVGKPDLLFSQIENIEF